MAFSIKDEAIDKDVRYLACLTGASLTEAVGEAVRDKIAQVTCQKNHEKQARHAQLSRFLEARPRLRYQNNRSLRDIRDALWE